MTAKNHINKQTVSTSEGFGKAIVDEAEFIAKAVGEDPNVTLSALLIVLSSLLSTMKEDVREQVIDGIPTKHNVPKRFRKGRGWR